MMLQSLIRISDIRRGSIPSGFGASGAWLKLISGPQLSHAKDMYMAVRGLLLA